MQTLKQIVTNQTKFVRYLSSSNGRSNAVLVYNALDVLFSSRVVNGVLLFASGYMVADWVQGIGLKATLEHRNDAIVDVETRLKADMKNLEGRLKTSIKDSEDRVTKQLMEINRYLRPAGATASADVSAAK